MLTFSKFFSPPGEDTSKGQLQVPIWLYMQHSHTISCFATEECHALPVASVSAVLGSYALYLLLGYIAKVLAKLAP